MTKFEETAPRLLGRLLEDFGKQGMTREDADAIVGNLAHECGGFEEMQERNPTVPGSKGGYGWAQWTGSRRKKFEAWLARKGWDVDEFEGNYSFLFRELIGSERKALAATLEAVGLEAKTRAFMVQFERPGIPHFESRLKWAQRSSKLTPVFGTSPYEKKPKKKAAPKRKPKEKSMFVGILASLVRHGLTVGAGYLVGKGVIAPTDANQIISSTPDLIAAGIITGATVVWSRVEKTLSK